MTLYRMSCIMLVLSVFCLAIAWGMGSLFYIFFSWICVVLAGQIYASAVLEMRGDKGRVRKH